MRILRQLVLALPLALAAAEPLAPEAADLAALKELLAQATTAFSSQDAAAMEKVLAPRFTVVMGDQRLASDRAGLQAGIERWCGPSGALAGVTFAPTVDRHAELVAPGVALVAGTSRDTYRPKAGPEVVVDARWTATAVKTPEGWRIAQLHLGIDPLDNPMIKQIAGRFGLGVTIAALIGVVAGLLAGWLLARRRRA